MKILSVLTYYSPHWTGLTVHATRVAEGLAALGHDVSVLTTRYRGDLPREETLNGVRVVRIRPIARLSRGMVAPGFPWAAVQMIRAHDVVQIHTPLPEAPLVALLCRLLGRPLLMTHHGDLVMPSGIFNQTLQEIGYWLTYLAGRLASRVTSYSKDYADHSRLLRRLSDRLAYVYPPVVFPTPDQGRAAAWRNRLGLDGRLLVGTAGRWVEEKGFDVLLQAIPFVQAELPEVHFLFAGERQVTYEDFYQRCEPLIEEHAASLTFLGLLHEPQQMADFYAMCDLFALPSRTDMMALTQVEAMLCGTPVVASDIPGARVVVSETGFGRLAPPEDPRGLAEALVAALRGREGLKPSRAAVREVFDPERSLRQYESLMLGIQALG